MEYSKLKLEIFESCDKGEITESEKCELLEKLDSVYCAEKSEYDRTRQINYWKQMIDSYKKKIESCEDEVEKRKWIVKLRDAVHHLKLVQNEKNGEEQKSTGIGMHGKMHVAFNSADSEDIEIDDNAITLEEAMNSISSYLEETYSDENESFTMEEAMNFVNDYLEESSLDMEDMTVDDMKKAIYESEISGEISVEERNELISYVESME